MTHAVVVLIGLFLSSAASAAVEFQPQDDEKPLKVFLFGGQSNMAGSGRANQLPEDLRRENDQILVLDNPDQPTEWVPFTPTGRIGPEVSFCASIAKELGEPVGMIKFAVGGSNLAVQWDPQGENNLYDKFRARVHAAKRLARPIEIVGMLWMQGERDSRSEEMAAAYAENLAGLVTAVRNEFEAAGLIFVCGRVNPHIPSGTVPDEAPKNYRFVFEVRRAQESLDLPRVGWVDCDDLSKLNDVLHYDTEGLVVMGNRMANKMIQLIQAK